MFTEITFFSPDLISFYFHPLIIWVSQFASSQQLAHLIGDF